MQHIGKLVEMHMTTVQETTDIPQILYIEQNINVHVERQRHDLVIKTPQTKKDNSLARPKVQYTDELFELPMSTVLENHKNMHRQSTLHSPNSPDAHEDTADAVQRGDTAHHRNARRDP